MIDDELKNALRRHHPPEGFADRVLARAAQESSTPPEAPTRNAWVNIFTQPLLRWTAASAVCMVLVVCGIHYRNVQRERAAGEAAKERLILALRIAGSKLHLAQTKIQQMNSDQTDNQQEKE
jgi:hypothetical protein